VKLTIKLIKPGEDQITIHQLMEETKKIPQINECGAIFAFEGLVRGEEKDLTTHTLNLTTTDYDKTQRELEKLVEDIKDKHQVKEVAVVHYLGQFQPGDPLFLVVVAGAHRQETRSALNEVIERVKYELEFQKEEETNQGNRTIMSGG
jgi:molybdopterin synthase catalytic subunit